MIIKLDKKSQKLLKKAFQDHSLQFKCYDWTPFETHEVWTRKIIELYKDKQAVGFIKLMYYDPQNHLYAMKDCLDFFAVQKSNTNFQSWFEHRNLNFFHQFGFKDPIYEISQKYEKEYNDFLQLWSNKPTVELVCVYSKDDKTYTSHKNDFHTVFEREPINYRQQGFGKTLYLAAALCMKQKDMPIYSSLKQTTDGKNMWNFINKNPQFVISCETISKKINGQQSEVSRSFFHLDKLKF